ncbi:MAG TPA: DbpA RNA binding domain-containing protein, partial [Vicinamibacterales bacterium]|nr:DbpA RNA binding domain-containing protein [Vicinamibacterales bacterium]
DDREIPAVMAPAAKEKAPRSTSTERPREAGGTRLLKSARGRTPREREAGDGDGDRTRLFVGAGRRAGVRPGDLVGAITGEAGIDSREIGAIEISDGFSLVEVPEARAQEIIVALRATKIRGHKVIVRRER